MRTKRGLCHFGLYGNSVGRMCKWAPLASPARRKGFTPGVGGALPLCSDDVVVCIARCTIIRDKMPHDVEREWVDSFNDSFDRSRWRQTTPLGKMG